MDHKMNDTFTKLRQTRAIEHPRTHTLAVFPAYAAMLALAMILLTGCGRQSVPPAQEEAATGQMEAQAKGEGVRFRLSASDGGKLLLRAIDAHGGIEAWYSAPTSSYSWEYSNVGAKLRFKSYLVADNATRQIYHQLQTLGTPEKTEPLEGRFAWDGEKAWISPPDIERINPRFWALTGYYFEQIPFVLADSGVNYEKLPGEELDGVPHDMVKCSFGVGVGDSPGDTYTLYINRDSGLVDAIRYTVTFYSPGSPPAAAKKKTASGPRETLFYYEDYVEVDGLKVPAHFRGYDFLDGKKGDFKNEAWCTDISFRRPFDESQLQMPADARVQPMPGE